MNQDLFKLGKHFTGIWKQLGVNQRVSIVLATLVLLVGLSVVAYLSSRTEYALLYGRLAETEAAKVAAALDEAKVPYKVGASGGSILVPSDKVRLMRLKLAERGIPKGDGVGFEIFDKPNFGISDFVQRANYVRAVQGELARTIAELDEIESARVMVVLPENRLLLDKDKHPTASVFVRLRGNGQLQPQTINAIRFLVANAVEGLKPNFVTVVDNAGNALSENTDTDSISGLSTTQLAARRNLELYLARKAQDMLEAVLGPGQAIVRVAAEINYDTITRVEEKFDPEGQVLKSQTKNEENNDTTTTTPAASPVGVTANIGDDAGDTNSSAAPSPVAVTKNKKQTGTTEYEISKTVSNVMQAAGGIKRLSAAVTVASRFEGTGAERKMVSRSPEELDKLRRIVHSALGIQGDATRSDLVTLEELPFNDQLATVVTEHLERQHSFDFWWNLVRNTLPFVLGVAALLVFLRLFQRTPVDDIPIGIPIGQLGSPGNGNGNGNSHGHGWDAEQHREAVSVETINQLIRENPSNMAQAIRSWLGRGKTTTR